MTATVQTRILEGFDDPTFGPDQWDSLLQRTGTDNVYLTWQWQRAWWEAFGKGNPFLIVVERQGRVVALAPLYVRSGMVYFIGAAYWEADRLDFIGDVAGSFVLVVAAAVRLWAGQQFLVSASERQPRRR